MSLCYVIFIFSSVNTATRIFTLYILHFVLSYYILIQVRRAIEKENKKEREKARKGYIDLVREARQLSYYTITLVHILLYYLLYYIILLMIYIIHLFYLLHCIVIAYITHDYTTTYYTIYTTYLL